MSKNAFKDVVDSGREMTEAAGRVATDYAHEKMESATDAINDKKKTAEKFLKQNPWKAMGITAAAGFVMALLLRGLARK